MSVARRLTAVLLPAALLATGGCLATSGDIEKLQLTLKSMQDSIRVRDARSDSLQVQTVRAAALQLAQQFARELAVVSDAVRQLSGSVQRLQGDVTLSMHDLRTQLVTVQEGIGQSRKGIQDLKSTVESAAPVAMPPAAPGKGADPAAVGVPPAATLFSLGRKSLIGNATGAAREAFQQLITSYPTSDQAGEAQMNIGNAYAQEGNPAAADSVYALVTTKYAGRPEAATSLYKRAMALKEAGQAAQARKLFQEIMDKYPRSDEGYLTVEILKSLKQP